MQEYGAYEAMHLDGGGSSTMAVKTTEDSSVNVVNKVSEGSERRVINAVGIFQMAEKGAVQEIRMQPSMTRTLAGKPITFTVYGLDEHYNRIEIPAEQVTLDAVGVEGTWSGYSFTPKTSGTFTVIATYNNLVAYQQNVVSGKVARLSPTNASIKLNKAGETATIAMNAYDQDGFSYWASTSTNYSVADGSIGSVSGNVFTAKKTGATYIKCEKDGVVAYITVTVGNAAAVKAPCGGSGEGCIEPDGNSGK